MHFPPGAMRPEIKLAAALFRRGMSAADLHRASGVSESSISKNINFGNQFVGGVTAKTDRAMTPYMAQQYAPHLGVTVEWLFDGKNDIPDYIEEIRKELKKRAEEQAAAAAAPSLVNDIVPLIDVTSALAVVTAPPPPPSTSPAPIGATSPLPESVDPDFARAKTAFEYAILYCGAKRVIRALETLRAQPGENAAEG